MKINRAMLGLVLMLSLATASAQWKVTTKKDSMTDETRKSATVTNDQGHSLSVYRHASGSVWANFSLSDKSADQLAPKKPPMYRVDKREAHDIADEMRLQEMGVNIQAYAWEPKWVNFLIWHGKDAEGRSGALNQLMDGNVVVFRYNLFTGGYKETSFLLNGAAPAIASALGISVRVDRGLAERQTAVRPAYAEAMKRCAQEMNTFSACSQRALACAKQANNDDLAVFQKCMQ